MNVTKKLAGSICLFALIFSFSSYAEEAPSDSLKAKIEISSISSNSSEAGYSRCITNEGNVYELDENGKILTSYTNEDGEIFDENGYLINLGAAVEEKYKEKADQYEKGYGIKFEDKKDFQDFLEYYCTQYSYFDTSQIFTMKGDENVSFLDKRYLNEKEITEQLILSNFEPIQGDTVPEKVENTCREVSEKLTYNLDHLHSSVETCLNDGTGVCWHYAKIAKTLLEDAGVEVELVQGRNRYDKDYVYHMWIRCKDGDHWIYSDPTLYDTTGTPYSNISYLLYLMQYQQIPIIKVT